MRRVVTGIDGNGKSVFVHDGPAPEVTAGGGFELGALWSSHAATRLGDSATDAALGKTATVPAPGATVFTCVLIPPDVEGDAAGFDATGSTATEFHVEDDGRMHRTDTIDYGVIVQGELWLELDDGRELLLRAGDCFVQNGTRHAWHNRGTAPAIMCVAMIGLVRPG